MSFSDKEVDNKLIKGTSSDWQSILKELERSYSDGDSRTSGRLMFDLQEASHGWLLGIAKMWLSEEDAKEAVGDAYFGLHMQLEQGRPIEHLKAFLRTLVKRRAIDILRKPKENVVSLGDMASQEGKVPEELIVNSHRKVEDDMVFDSLKNALLEKMPWPERGILILRHYQGLSVEETAARLGVTVDVVKKRSKKAKEIGLAIAREQGIEK